MVFQPKAKERARFNEIEFNPELKEKLGIKKTADYVRYFAGEH